MSAQQKRGGAVTKPRRSGKGKSGSCRNKKCSFLHLPPEIRNKIYDMTFEERVILVGHGKRGKDRRYLHNVYIKKPFLPQREEYVPHHDKVGVDLLFTCKFIYGEALSLFYSKMAFGFNSAKTIRRFIYRTPRAGLAAITQIGIHQQGYGEPTHVSGILWKHKFDRAWVILYRDINLLMPNLRYFALSLQVRSWPIKLRLDELWAATILQLESRRFFRARVSIYSPMIPEERLRDAEEQMLRELMIPADQTRSLGIDLPSVHSKWMYGDRFDTLSHVLGPAESGVQNFPNIDAIMIPPPPLPKATRILRINIPGSSR